MTYASPTRSAVGTPAGGTSDARLDALAEALTQGRAFSTRPEDGAAFARLVAIVQSRVASNREVEDLRADLARSREAAQTAERDKQRAIQEKTEALSRVRTVTNEMKESVGMVARAAGELRDTVAEIAKNAAESARTAREAREMGVAVKAVVEELSKSSTEIGKVTRVINGIASQTNLLALNASIESARAGEAGRGFSVVANEVKELAKETGKATQEISRKIETIQGDTARSVEGIGQIVEVVAQIDGYAESIATAVEEQAATVKHIADAAAQVSSRAMGVVAQLDSTLGH